MVGPGTVKLEINRIKEVLASEVPVLVEIRRQKRREQSYWNRMFGYPMAA
jgi:hypothetical protein